MMRWQAVFALAFSVPLSLGGQATTGPLWVRDSIRSEILGETRQLRIALPLGYNGPAHATERYPVLITLDAQSGVMSDAAIVNARSLGLPGDPAVPPVLIVGVATSVHRYRDMTPEMPGGATGDYAGSGGGPSFLRFMTTELLPFIAQRYRALPMTVLAGHSMSGLFAAWAYGQAPDVLTGAIALSPSLQESEVFTQQAFDGIQKRSQPGRLFVLNSTAEGVELDSAVQAFAARMRARANPATAFEYRRVAGLSHSHTPLVGMIDGLRFIFDPVSLSGSPLVSQARRVTPQAMIAKFEEIRAQYARSARELGMPDALPSSFIINVSVQYRAPDRALALLHLCKELMRSYPTLWNGFACAADAQSTLGDIPSAVANYARAIDLARQMRDTASVPELTQKRSQLKGR